ncbi:MAG: methyltransferase domain-containing protein [Alphaproteobacteria bacterium]|nr:methyltransferase domain-containing protein [Alphaproteobacteria bacterium]
MVKDLAKFIGSAIRNPGQLGAVAPSSRALGRAMAAEIADMSGKVAEIGAGTGAITREILNAGLAPENLTALDLDAGFCRDLAAKFPGIHVLNESAQDLAAHGLKELAAVVSGLPLLNMPASLRLEIAQSAFAALKPGAPFIQFTYGNAPPLPDAIQETLQLKWVKRPRVWTNLPPATVYVFRQSISH